MKAQVPVCPVARQMFEAPIVPLRLGDLAEAMVLSASARWNQNEADWRIMLELGQGWGIRDTGVDGREMLAASTVVMPYGGRFAWISMVLVLPEFRRRGHATRLLRHALGVLSSLGLRGVLDATPDGRAVYAKEGFRGAWGFARYRREHRAGSAPEALRTPAPATRSLLDSDWPAIEAMDMPAFGANRIAVLRRLARRLPHAARVVDEAGQGGQGPRLRGFVLGRDGREAFQIGPLLADDMLVATSLIADALCAINGPAYVDLLDDRAALQGWLQRQGFVVQRPFTRMVHGLHDAPGRPDGIALVAGPELG
jgi:GNAT superfamily N-acetyltransferase